MGCKIPHEGTTPKKQQRYYKGKLAMVLYIDGIDSCLCSNAFLGFFLGGIHSGFYYNIFTRSLGGIGSHHLYSKTFPTFFLDGIDSGLCFSAFLSFFSS
jgi:hypothetical protein